MEIAHIHIEQRLMLTNPVEDVVGASCARTRSEGNAKRSAAFWERSKLAALGPIEASIGFQGIEVTRVRLQSHEIELHHIALIGFRHVLSDIRMLPQRFVFGEDE